MTARKPRNQPEGRGLTGWMKFRTPEMLALAKKKADELESYFPIERCREMMRITRAEMEAKTKIELHLLTPAQDAEFMKEEVEMAVYTVVAAWIGVLGSARDKSKGVSVRLDSSLLPPPELARYRAGISGGIGWDEALTVSLFLTVGQIRELMALYAIKLVPVFNSDLANNPTGIHFGDGVFVGKDADGFYILPKVKE